jgi:hypothetical protein
MKIGITERGDAGIDLSWANKLDKIDGAILITKKLTDECISKIIKNKDKIILHATCTGYGGTILEPNVLDYKWQINQINKLINQNFPTEQIVIRIDPIIPTIKGLNTAQKVLNYIKLLNLNTKRIRISLIDMYPYVRKRFIKKSLTLPYENNFSPNKKQSQLVDDWVKQNSKDFIFESCAEPQLTNCQQIGCISNKDLYILHIPTNNTAIGGYQRKGCLCLNCKTELLSNKHPCPNKCLYCYWN